MNGPSDPKIGDFSASSGVGVSPELTPKKQSPADEKVGSNVIFMPKEGLERTDGSYLRESSFKSSC